MVQSVEFDCLCLKVDDFLIAESDPLGSERILIFYNIDVIT